MDLNGIVSVLAIVTALGAVVYSIWSSKDTLRSSKNKRNIDDLVYKYNALETKIRADSYVIDTITGALHALDNRQSIFNLAILEEKGDQFFIEEEQAQYQDLQRRLTELGLFSKDQERRISAQRTLAHADGDFKSLELIKLIEKGQIGERDPEIKEQIKILEKRLKKQLVEFQRWSGRPSGGEF